MPYELRGDCVHKQGDDTPIKCHESHAKALAHMRALEANVEDATEKSLIEKAGRVLSSQSAGAVMDAFNATANAMNKLMNLLKRAGIEQMADEKPADKEPEPEAEPADDSEEQDVEEKMMDGTEPDLRPSQDEASYTPHTDNHEQSCEYCRWFRRVNQGGPACRLIQNYPLDILPAGHCERWEAFPVPDAEPKPMMVMVERETIEAEPEHMGIVERLRRALRKPAPDDAAFMIYKGVDGKPRWFARHTNNFEDLEGDIFSERAHDRYIARLNAGLVPMPYLRFWHLQGTEHGRATKIMRDSHIVMAVGTFDDTPFAQKCLKYYQKHRGQIKLSQGAFVPKWARMDSPDVRGRLFTDYNGFEISTLPPFLAKAANPYTTFSEDVIMALKPEQKELLVKEFGQEEANRIEAENETLNKTLEQLLQFKDFADLVTKTEEKPVTNDKALASLYRDIAEGQALVVKIAETVAKQVQEKDVQIDALRKELEVVKADASKALATLALTPRRAATDPATALNETEAAQVKKEIPTEVDPFFGALGVKKEA